ncbi:putative aminoadipate reductase [Hygrophoropsis aurantiaca]|uniref:Aminoadipate reductase n=1 Tax=Hygrophoropsis aurantiaca TaxID=72124 RepID=A0ACB8AM33_9AGAM|nr:putative aminoadipate reductase [Hygrophoropsis aurantiaca]
MSTSGFTRNSLHYPPLDGSLFVPEIVEFNAVNNPNVPIFVFEREGSEELVQITHFEFYRACQRVAHAIRPTREGPEGEIVAVIANSDTLLYHALVIGMMMAGVVPFPMSPRNSPAAVINMLQKTSCHRILTTQRSLTTLLDGIKADLASVDSDQAKFEVTIEEVPSLAQVFPALGSENPIAEFQPFPKADRRPNITDVMVILHSSGSTGFPKPIPQTYQMALHWCLTPGVLGIRDYSVPIRTGAMSLPSFHTLGFYVQLYTPIVALTSIALYPPTSYNDPLAAPVIPNSQNILEHIKKTKSNSLVVVPSFLELWSTSPEAIEILKSLEYVVFSGGPLASKIGDALVAAGIRISSVYGGTEFGAITTVIRRPGEWNDWQWTRFSDKSNLRWVPQGDGTYELQVLTCETHQVAVENLPDVKGYATSDVFVKHPTVEGLYRIVGRVDDVLILSSGEKTVPAPMEGVIGANPIVGGTAMFGRERNQVGILIEPRPGYEIDIDDQKQVAEFRNKIWPEVEEANKEAPSFSRIFKEMILVTHPNKPMLRAGKGTVMKKATVNLYKDEIDALYESVEASTKAGTDVPLPETWTEAAVEAWLLIHAAAVNSDKEVAPDVDLFEQGFDSLSATFLKNRILGSLASSTDSDLRAAVGRINQNIIFTSPTIKLLSKNVIGAVANDERATAPDAKQEIEAMIEKYSVGLGKIPSANDQLANENSSNSHVVLLTGSTGGLGTYLLASLLGNKDVTAVYAFNRPSKGNSTIEERQLAGFVDRGFDEKLLASDKLFYLEGDTAQENLGLEASIYEKLRASTTVIIHNAWRLDFNLSLSSFEPNVRGTRNLIELARSSPLSIKPRFLFTSSISSAQAWDRSKGPFPEEVQFDAGVAAGLGYGASKYVCERLLVNSGLEATSFRIGQISGGAPRGAWSVTDWLPIIVKSSVALGKIPDMTGVVAWLPPHAVSNAILDVAFLEKRPPIAINLVHPRPVTWTSVMQPVSYALSRQSVTGDILPLIPFKDWFASLETLAKDMNSENIRRIPAIKLLAFMRALAAADTSIRGSGQRNAEAGGFTPFATEKARAVSPTMRELKPLTSEEAERWVQYWTDVGMFL